MYLEKKDPDLTVNAGLHSIKELRFLTNNTFVLRLDRGGMEFKAGQHMIVSPEGEMDQREYSVYSGEKDDYLEILVREVLNGKITGQLKDCKPGQLLQVNGPFGSFGIESYDRYSRKLVFIATGTGISPFHSFVRSYPGIDYTIIHGVRYGDDAYDKDEYDPERYILCTSNDNRGNHNGRITTYLPHFSVDNDMLFYLCGNNSMIYEAYHILRDKGIRDENIFMEIYF